ncbi:MAG TPA: hypothetical protein VGM56_31115, partial [Byssovorax sp.]
MNGPARRAARRERGGVGAVAAVHGAGAEVDVAVERAADDDLVARADGEEPLGDAVAVEHPHPPEVPVRIELRDEAAGGAGAGVRVTAEGDRLAEGADDVDEALRVDGDGAQRALAHTADDAR